MKKIVLIIYVISIFTACSNTAVESPTKPNYPTCLQTTIDAILKNDIEYPKDSKPNIKKYSYKDQFVYLIDICPNCPDNQAAVINEKCESICRIGGIDGKNTCLNWDKAVFVETVWTDPR
jgi:hypothetical protein